MTFIIDPNNSFDGLFSRTSSYYKTIEVEDYSDRYRIKYVPLEIFINPSFSEMKKEKIWDQDGSARGIIDADENNLYVWRGFGSFHQIISQNLNLDNYVAITIWQDGEINVTDGTSTELKRTNIPANIIRNNENIYNITKNENPRINYFDADIVGDWENIDEENIKQTSAKSPNINYGHFEHIKEQAKQAFEQYMKYNSRCGKIQDSPRSH